MYRRGCSFIAASATASANPNRSGRCCNRTWIGSISIFGETPFRRIRRCSAAASWRVVSRESWVGSSSPERAGRSEGERVTRRARRLEPQRAPRGRELNQRPFQSGTVDSKLENVWQAKDLQTRFLDVWQGKDLAARFL